MSERAVGGRADGRAGGRLGEGMDGRAGERAGGMPARCFENKLTFIQ